MDVINTNFKTRTIGFIITGLSLTCGMAWNESIRQMINTYFPLSTDILVMKVAYALVLTLVLVLLAEYLQKIDLDSVRNTVLHTLKQAGVETPNISKI